MGHLSLEAKESIVRKALNRGNTKLTVIAEENNIGVSTLQRWIKAFNSGKPTGAKNSDDFTNKSEKLSHIIATANLDSPSLGAYCRKNGLYSHQLEEWRIDMTKPTNESKSSEYKLDLKKLKQEIDHLKKELRRKDKALSEASALLIMKKKAHLIWGESEDD